MDLNRTPHPTPEPQVVMEDPDEPEWNAVILEPSHEDLVRQLQFAVQNPMWRKKAAKAAVEFVHSKYTLEHVTRKLMAVILEKPERGGWGGDAGAAGDYLEL